MKIEPVGAPREQGWAASSKTWKAIGTCRAPHKDGKTALYEIYGVRGEEIFVQYQGFIDTDGCIWGVSLLASSLDSENYFWCRRDTFTAVHIDAPSPRLRPPRRVVPPSRLHGGLL